MFIRLSHILKQDSPGWPGNPTLEVTPHTSMDEGHIVNHHLITIFSHFGTHLDAPLHWTQHGATVTDLPLDHFIYERPLVLDIPKGPEEFITAAELQVHQDELAGRDLVLLRTGFSRLRHEDPERYAGHGPALSPEGARFLLKEGPELKAVGTDCISIASPAMLDEAIEVHRLLCGYYGDNPILILEDLDLDFDLTNLKRVLALPLFIEGLEGSPCTVVAEIS